MAIPALEKKKFSATDRPRAPRATTPTHPRTIPAHVQRDVWKRDDDRCTFKSATGRRCEATRSLEFDHVKPVALGGQGSVDNVRLLCRKHNQLEAERRLGADLMKAKRAAAKRRGAANASSSPIAGSNRFSASESGRAPHTGSRSPAPH
jgi:5-methylcytosine-specific restriction endonuclease McrA